jgi:hypothetical protein
MLRFTLATLFIAIALLFATMDILSSTMPFLIIAESMLFT